jgi:hypothetical protein
VKAGPSSLIAHRRVAANPSILIPAAAQMAQLKTAKILSIIFDGFGKILQFSRK